MSGEVLVNGQTRAEVTGDPDNTATDYTEVDTTAFMVTGLIDIAALAEENWLVKPYAGLGIGFENTINGGSDTGFAWKFVAGATYQLDDNLVLDASYQYADYGSTETGTNWGGVEIPNSLKVDVNSHEVMFALRYMF